MELVTGIIIFPWKVCINKEVGHLNTPVTQDTPLVYIKNKHYYQTRDDHTVKCKRLLYQHTAYESHIHTCMNKER